MSKKSKETKKASKSQSSKKLDDNKVAIVIICMGFPGSGKSTFALDVSSLGYVRVNQDDIGSQEECEKLLEKSLKHKKSIILDRCNIHPKERKQWAQKAIKYGAMQIVLVWFSADVETCKARVRARIRHPTLAAGDESDKVIEEFASGFKPPTSYEYKYHHRFEVDGSMAPKSGGYKKKYYLN